MANFRNIQEALRAIDDDAAESAWTYLEREAPATAGAIKYLIEKAGWSAEQVWAHFDATYGPTEERKMHKVKLVIEALIAERNRDRS